MSHKEMFHAPIITCWIIFGPNVDLSSSIALYRLSDSLHHLRGHVAVPNGTRAPPSDPVCNWT